MQQRLGRYELVERIASGGQGTVWHARDPNLDRIVAIKVLNQPVADDPRYLESLQREARLAAWLIHPNITAVHDFQVEGDIAYIVMEYVPDTLSNHMQNGQPLPYQRAVEIAIQICRALSHAHSREVIHRDIKLQNILLTEDGNVKVSDFGIARALASDPPIILADEPTGNLDSENANQIMTLLTDLHSKFKKTLIVVTHRNDFIKLADRVFIVEDGQMSEHGDISWLHACGYQA